MQNFTIIVLHSLHVMSQVPVAFLEEDSITHSHDGFDAFPRPLPWTPDKLMHVTSIIPELTGNVFFLEYTSWDFKVKATTSLTPLYWESSWYCFQISQYTEKMHPVKGKKWTLTKNLLWYPILFVFLKESGQLSSYLHLLFIFWLVCDQRQAKYEWIRVVNHN